MMFLNEFHGSDAARLTAAADEPFAARAEHPSPAPPVEMPASTTSSKAPRPPAR